MEKTYKRQYREQSPETKQRISQALMNRPKPDSVKNKISDSLKNYWRSVPSKNEVDDNDEGWEDVM